jgi:hypothetical protein
MAKTNALLADLAGGRAEGNWHARLRRYLNGGDRQLANYREHTTGNKRSSAALFDGVSRN